MAFTSRIITDFSSISRREWALLDHADNPFLSHAFLGALESTGSITPENGWQPNHLALFDEHGLAAFAPTYLKSNSHGEFVFDWAWADAYQRHGLPYYPKWLTAIPYTPVSGPRLLVRSGHPDPVALRQALADMAVGVCEQNQLSSWHCNFISDEDGETLEGCELLARQDWQFHWHNRDYGSFDDFLATLRSRKRKNIRRERAQVAASGLEFRTVHGDELQTYELEFVYGCYLNTFLAYGNYPALSKELFALVARELGRGVVVVLAARGGENVAMALFLAGGGSLYGRYWGCVEEIPGLHFEVSYYQGIEYCIREGIGVFESGAQGEHKIARGFSCSQTRSFHHVCQADFRRAIADHLLREREWLVERGEQLRSLDPYRRDLA